MSMVDVVIPVYNRKEYLPFALESVAKQTFKDYTVYVVDDCSDEDLSGVIDDAVNTYNMKIVYIRNDKNMGVSFSRNRAIKSSDSKYIALLDSDDRWLPEKLKRQINIFNQYDIKVVHTEEIWMRNGKRVNQKKRHYKGSEDFFNRSLELCLMSPSSIMIERSVFDDFGFFDESLPVCEDYDMWLRILSHENVYFIEDPLIVKYGGHVDQLSHKFYAIDRFRVRSLIKLLGDESIKQNNLKKMQIKMVISKKCDILINGALKRDKFEDAEKYRRLLKESESL